MSAFIGYLVALFYATFSIFGVAQPNPSLSPVQQTQTVQQSTDDNTLATIDQQSLSATSSTPTITGRISNLREGIHIVLVKGKQALPGIVRPTPLESSQPVGLALLPGFVTIAASDHGGSVNFIYDSNHQVFGYSVELESLSSGLYTVGVYQIATQYGNDGFAGYGTSTLLTSGTLTIPTATTQTSAVSVPGMQKYTDADFGFSFWYPSGWSVTRGTIIAKDMAYYGDSSTEPYDSLKITHGETSFSLIKIRSTSGIHDHCGSCSHIISFDSAKKQWVEFSTYGGLSGGSTTEPVQVSWNTMGGLAVLGTIVPLGANTFIVAESAEAKPLIKTIIATDPSVATPISAAEQIKAIQAEKDAYANQ